MVIVSDTSPLINLAIIGHLDLIPRLFHSVILPQTVFDEIVTAGAGLPGGADDKSSACICKQFQPKIESCKQNLRYKRPSTTCN
jgi:hypothetical protein